MAYIQKKIYPNFGNMYIAAKATNSYFEFIIEPMLHHNLTLFETLLRHPHDDRGVAVSMVVDINRVLTEADSIERIDNGKLGGRKS